VNGLGYFLSIINGSDWLAVSGRDTHATWRSLVLLCRERGWSKVARGLRAGLQRWADHVTRAEEPAKVVRLQRT
jgi:hypothetical protein